MLVLQQLVVIFRCFLSEQSIDMNSIPNEIPLQLATAYEPQEGSYPLSTFIDLLQNIIQMSIPEAGQ